MAARVGNIYKVDVGDDTVRYFWDIGTDQTQLGSPMIVVFRRSYPKSASPDLEEIVSDEIEFYCHTMVSSGIKLGLWSKVGFRRVDRIFPMSFRISADQGNPAVRVSERWHVWEPSQPMRYVGKLTGENRKAEIGLVFNARGVFDRIMTGAWDGFYQTYE